VLDIKNFILERLSRLPAFTIVDVPPTRAQIPMNLDFSIETQTEENYSPNCLEKGFCAEAFSQTDYLNLSLAGKYPKIFGDVFVLIFALF
jgi:hypothetical protein